MKPVPVKVTDEGALVRRMHRARVRQWTIAATSVMLASFGAAFLTPIEIGSFAYYTLLGLMLLNATIAVRQCIHVIFPIETLLRSLHRAEHDIDNGELCFKHFSIHANDAFSTLTAGMDNLIAKLSEKARVANEEASLNAAMLQAVPFTICTVSSSGTVYSIIKNEYDIVSLLDLKVGTGPSKESFGESNMAKYLESISNSFKNDGYQWFDLEVDTHHLRGCVKRLNKMTSIVMFGVLPAIDQNVKDMTGTSSESDFTHRQNALKRFAASVAHDGNNIFCVLKHIQKLNQKSNDPVVREQATIAEDAIRRGMNLMTELSAFAGETQLNLKCMSAKESALAILEAPSLKALLPDNVKLMVSISDETMPEIDIDTDQMWKVASNLIKNSVEAMNGNEGRIWVNVEPCQLSEDAARSFRHSSTLCTGSGILVTVIDDGPGIPDAMFEHMFEPFVSSKDETRGIGLATVLTIIDAHCGAISVKSSPGYGTTFYIFLPASRNTPTELKLIQEIAPNGEILLVDDDPTILHTTKLVLKSLQIAAHPASTESDALAKIRVLRNRLRAVLVDANIGCSSSANLVRTINATIPSLPIILVSGAPQETIARRFSGVHYDSFLSKPYAVSELFKTLSDVAPMK